MLSSVQLSKYRKDIGRILRKINYLSGRCLFKDSIIHGTPAEVYRTCGSSQCKCAQGGDQRHGPYTVIQVVENGKQKQVSIRKSDRVLWEQAKMYQYQIDTLKDLKELCQVLQQTVSAVIEERISDLPKGK